MDPLQAWLDTEEVRRLAEGLMAPPRQMDESAADAAYGQDFEGFAGDNSLVGDAVVDPGQSSHQVKSTQAMPSPLQGDSGPAVPAEKQVVHEPAPELPPVQQAAKPFFRPAIDARGVASNPDLSDGHDVEPQQSYSHQASQASAQASQASAATRSGEIPNQPQSSDMSFISRLEHFSRLIRQGMGARAMFLIDDDGQILLDEVKNEKLIRVARTLTNGSCQVGRRSDGAAPPTNLHVKITASTTLQIMTVQSRYGILILGVIFPAPIGVARVIQLSEQLFQAIDPPQ